MSRATRPRTPTVRIGHLLEEARLRIARGILNSRFNTGYPPFDRLRDWAWNTNDRILLSRDWPPLTRIPEELRGRVLRAANKALPPKTRLKPGKSLVSSAMVGTFGHMLSGLATSGYIREYRHLAKHGFEILKREDPERIPGARVVDEKPLKALDGTQVMARTFLFPGKGRAGNQKPVAILVPGIGHGLSNQVHFSVAKFLAGLGFDVVGIDIPEYRTGGKDAAPELVHPNDKAEYVAGILAHIQDGHLGNRKVGPDRLMVITHSLGTATYADAQRKLGFGFAPPVIAISPLSEEQRSERYEALFGRDAIRQDPAIIPGEMVPRAASRTEGKKGAMAIANSIDPRNRIGHRDKWYGWPAEHVAGNDAPYTRDPRYRIVAGGLAESQLAEKIAGLPLSEMDRERWGSHNYVLQQEMRELLLRIYNFAHEQGLTPENHPSGERNA